MTADIGLIGLGVMGQNLALNLEEHGFTVAVWNYETEWMTKFLAAHPGKKFVGAQTLAEFAQALKPPRAALLMITAGAPVDSTIEKLAPLFSSGDIIIDGGNSWFRDTERRVNECQKRSIEFVGMGVSGGAEGARKGPSMMPGGSEKAYARLKPMLEAMSAKSSFGACVAHVGPGASGHFVKMVHNGIEYGDMQLIAEAYDLMRVGLGLQPDELAAQFDEWNKGPLESFLMELTAQIFRVKDGETGKPLVDLVLDVAEQKGTGKWTAQVALDLGIPVPTIAQAIFARSLSARRDERLTLSAQFKGPARSAITKEGRPPFLDAVRDALWAAKWCAYAQGMELIREASSTYKWNIDLGEMARIWTGGCIIRARMLGEIREVFQKTPTLANLLLDAKVAKHVEAAQSGFRRAVSMAAALGVPVPAMSASLAYLDSYRSASLPQNLVQAQRDAFGAHTYVRNDRPDKGHVHSEWSGKV